MCEEPASGSRAVSEHRGYEADRVGTSGGGGALHRIQRLHREGEAMIDEEVEGVDVRGEEGGALAAHGFHVVHTGVLGAVRCRG